MSVQLSYSQVALRADPAGILTRNAQPAARSDSTPSFPDVAFVYDGAYRPQCTLSLAQRCAYGLRQPPPKSAPASVCTLLRDLPMGQPKLASATPPSRAPSRLQRQSFIQKTIADGRRMPVAFESPCARNSRLRHNMLVVNTANGQARLFRFRIGKEAVIYCLVRHGRASLALRKSVDQPRAPEKRCT